MVQRPEDVPEGSDAEPARPQPAAALPNLQAERAKWLPTGTAKKLALEAAKEAGDLAFECAKQGGLPPLSKLVSLALKAVGIYRSKRQEALHQLEVIRLKGRERWGTSILRVVKTEQYTIQNNDPARTQVDAFLGEESVEATSAEEHSLQALAGELAVFEKAAAETAERASSIGADSLATQELQMLEKTLTAGKNSLTAMSQSAPAATEESPAKTPVDALPAPETDTDKQRQYYSGLETDASGRKIFWINGLKMDTYNIEQAENFENIFNEFGRMIIAAERSRLQPWVPGNLYAQMGRSSGDAARFSFIPPGAINVNGVHIEHKGVVMDPFLHPTFTQLRVTLPNGKVISANFQPSNNYLVLVSLDGQNQNTESGMAEVVALLRPAAGQTMEGLANTPSRPAEIDAAVAPLKAKFAQERRQHSGVEQTDQGRIFWIHGQALPESYLSHGWLAFPEIAHILLKTQADRLRPATTKEWGSNPVPKDVKAFSDLHFDVDGGSADFDLQTFGKWPSSIVGRFVLKNGVRLQVTMPTGLGSRIIIERSGQVANDAEHDECYRLIQPLLLQVVAQITAQSATKAA